jgi:hypothetical protein
MAEDVVYRYASPRGTSVAADHKPSICQGLHRCVSELTFAISCKAPRAFKDKAAALLILGATNEYLYWNLNCERSTRNLTLRALLLLPRLRHRSLHARTLQKRPQGSFLL